MAKAKGGGNPRSIPDGKIQVNFNINSQSLEKVKSIAFIEGVSNSDIYNKAVDVYVVGYEKKNGKVKPKPKGTGLDL